MRLSGILEDGILATVPDRLSPGGEGTVLVATFVEDYKGRWPPGRLICTSLIERLALPYVFTLNSVYELIGQLEETRLTFEAYRTLRQRGVSHAQLLGLYRAGFFQSFDGG
ncbi:hypothetical protein [Gimibacter soli]|uniref:Uncharacterized protein n=1 Tax=Gimibacter soli TaxID=3024400 RepID=A0AAE9XR03_9PROT|nr:hypothetical protein [Gimibacter soli]WCL55602.1 hypothetical protein PH603_07485 [Gimibacter soli]